MRTKIEGIDVFGWTCAIGSSVLVVCGVAAMVKITWNFLF